MEITRPRRSSLSIELTPLVDVVFQLLVFFMLASTFSKPVINMVLPKAATQDEVTQEAIVVSINADEQLFLNQQPVTMADLPVRVQAMMKESGARDVHIRGDEGMAYKRFVEVMDVLRQAGARQVNLVHEE